ncbi:peptidoglycan glycosyltransferase FtsI [Blochmannia endosymbiont of Colobopsis nipponica]|uniref:peptidoglycan glycosyltransferase FtsI n=1 Tax=Blochmannia endosymbiont of Colobopsis nipponica TaxID=2681987 RepID=UPI00178171A2|nr:peptidoglycan glycosyltransferase FtsI [Blochmannia endosymbiont of Colobopsis nipponica]QOI11272.1 peptidoglycan glycosyltransferase FtsI [Blochmannia endosymbiont of Colobopsis nipponica]
MKVGNLKIRKGFLGRRITIIYILFLSSICVLIFRITYLQVFNTDQLVKEGNVRSLRIKEISIIRGMITDRNGRLLAMSAPVCAVWADPKELTKYDIKYYDERWKLLSDVLSISLDKLVSRIYSNTESRFVYLARQVDFSIKDYILNLKFPGIYLQQEYRRYYPSGYASAHIVGITNIDGEGIEGVEKSFNAYLSGYPGEKIVHRDRFGRVIENVASVNSKGSHNITLSIDERMQVLLYRELNNAVIFHQAKSGSAVLIDVNTGEILSMVNSPSYDPNDLSNVTISSMRNRAITDLFEPGSTVKPIVVLSALESGIIDKNTVFNTAPYIINGYMIKDVSYYGQLTISEILQKSSNVGISRIALSMSSTILVNAYSRFGIGKSTNLGLVGENNGLYPKKQRWSDIDKAVFSYGYGFMVTPLQLARVYAIFGSMGIYRPLSILRIDRPVIGKQVFSSSLVHNVIHMMENVSLPGSSGVKAAIKGYRVAIKTGTVKKVGNCGRYINKYIAYTAGIAPVSRPRFALVVVIDEPSSGQYYGGVVSAPVFGTVMSGVLRMMNVEPDASKLAIKKICE